MNASIDENGVRTMLGTLQSDGVTTIKILINPLNGAMKVEDSSSGTYTPRVNDPRDQNSKAALMGVKSSDGVTPIPVASDVNGYLLIKST